MDSSEHQSIRDTERDVLCINGGRLEGSRGFSVVVEHLVSSLRESLPIPQEGAKVVPFQSLYKDLMGVDEGVGGSSGKALEEFSKALLKAVNRTESGHWSFALVRMLCSGPMSVIVPDSASAGPLTIDLDSGPMRAPFRGRRLLGWGLRARAEASTVYDIYDAVTHPLKKQHQQAMMTHLLYVTAV